MTPFLIALQFLTSLPVRLREMPEPADLGRSMLCYPLIGLLLGIGLWLVASGLDDSPNLLASALLLALWVGLTGGLHLDGLADSADAWLGGLGDRARTLAIMKDPRCGPMAVIVLVAILLLKFAAISALLAKGAPLALLLAAVASRTALIGLFLTTPYARPGGLGEALSQHLPRPAAKVVLAATAIAICMVGGWAGMSLLLVLGALFWWLRRAMLRRLGGTTGDTAGALLELTECAALVWLALV
jgi:adenosylcobinamide-GDP ribazoletransferase